MIKPASIFIVLTVSILVTLGCSQAGPVGTAPTSPAIDRSSEADGHVLLGYYRLYVDAGAGSVEVIPSRTVEGHFNVKPYVLPPNCNDCVKTKVTGPFQNNILPVDVTLKNPTQIKGHDVRGILLSDDPDAYLANPDNYTDLFDDGGDVNINPFKAFADTVIDRSFSPGESYTKSYNLWLSSMSKIAVLGYAIDASWPGRAKEPYEITTPILKGVLDNYGAQTLEIDVNVHAANNDVSEVELDASSIGFTDPLPMTNSSGATWMVSLSNEYLAGVGTYKFMISAKTSSSPKYLYSIFSVPVMEGVPPTTLSGDIQPIFDEFCISCHQSISPPVNLDLTSGNAYSNIVNVDSAESAVKRVTPTDPVQSYLLAKIMGIQLDDPYNGSGGQMPLSGPYLSSGQIKLVTQWIMQGALDN